MKVQLKALLTIVGFVIAVGDLAHAGCSPYVCGDFEEFDQMNGSLSQAEYQVNECRAQVKGQILTTRLFNEPGTNPYGKENSYIMVTYQGTTKRYDLFSIEDSHFGGYKSIWKTVSDSSGPIGRELVLQEQVDLFLVLTELGTSTLNCTHGPFN